ncbi:Mu transposase C-terminal domain-containing protein [Tabrizicola fusiformis]|uniref:Mu transposase C-terminal domain-containing protein n=1 Tax=Tabrizicola sp. SY72 TaxID=2741673 RepID=UPI001F506754|nr:Mu transposase C-terminal domain-containing protein [Tabrizicola sp. SY72]
MSMLPVRIAPAACGFREFLTAREIAEVAASRGGDGFPTSERGIRTHAEVRGWNGLPDHLTRWRPAEAKGGRPSREYHVTLLPDYLRNALAASEMQASLVRQHRKEQLVDQRRIDALRVAALPAGRRDVMLARVEILRSIEGFAIAQQQTRAWAIARFLEAQEGWIARKDAERRRDAGLRLTDREIAGLALRLALTADDGFQVDPSIIAKANDRRNKAGISRATIYEWFKARDERGLLALAPIPPKQAEPIPQAFFEFMNFYANPRKPSIADAHRKWLEAAEVRQGVQPMTLSLDQITRILRTRLNNIEKNVGREGILTLRARMPYVTRTTDDMWPTTVYTADGKTFDSEVADPVSRKPMRPEITSVLDVATRKCVGYAVSRKENTIAVTEALRRSCATNGICAIFYTDRGAGYKNKTFDADVGGLMGRLGITKMHALPYNSQAKGIIERFNHVWNDLAKRLPTYMGRDMDKEAKKAIHQETRREIKEFGQARRLPSWAEFIAAVEKTIADYNDREHTGLPRYEDPETGRLRHMTPNEAWALHVQNGFEPVRIDPEEMDDLFRPYEVRTVSRGLVKWNTNDYFHLSLEAYHGEEVAVGYDLHQADKVWVRELDLESGQPGRLICVAEFGGNARRYLPLTAEQKAVEDRNRTALKRLDRRRDDKLAELDAPFQLEQQAVELAEFIDLSPARPAEPVTLAVDNTAPASPDAPRRRVFRSDEELAAWAIQHPTELTPNQLRVLRDCISNSTARKVLEMAGIDTEVLRTLLRAAA